MSVRLGCDQIAASISDTYSIGPSIRLIYTRCFFTMTNMIQVCSNVHWAWVCIIDTRPDEILPDSGATRGPSWGHPRVVLGAVGSFLELFCGHLLPNVDKFSWKLTSEIPPRRASRGTRVGQDLIRTSIYDQHSGSMNITTHLDHISHCKKASGIN